LAAGILLSILGLGLAPWIMLLGALVAAGIELLTLSVNDNLVIPVIAGAVMEFALRWAR
jgi:dolichol kinase